MNWRTVFIWAISATLVVLAYRSLGWPGVAMVAGGLMMWLLLHFTRLMQVLKRAANRPIGHVDSAVMLNARLKPGMTLLHVVAMTRALGELLSAKDEQPEVFRWSDASQSQVSCEFRAGKLVRWELKRPIPADAPPANPPVSPAP
jgi:hypothetical protein